MRGTRASHSSTALAVLLLSLGLAVVGCKPSGDGSGEHQNGQKRNKLVFVTNAYSPFWDAGKAGWESAAKELGLAGAGYTTEFMVNEGGKLQGQIDKLRQLATQSDIAAVALSVNDSKVPSIADEMRNLQKRGIHIITVDSDVDRAKHRDARSYYIGTDNIKGGRELGKATKKLLEAKGKTSGAYVSLVGIVGAQNAIERMDGVQEAMGAAYDERDRMGDSVDLQKARDNVRNALTNHKDLVALVGIWSYNGPAIADVCDEKKVRDDLVCVTFDAEPPAVKCMSKGQLDALVVQNPFEMGSMAVKILKALIEKDQATLNALFPDKGKPDGDILETGLKVVVPDASSPLDNSLFDPATEFMTLDEFKGWLAKYNLTGS